MRVIVAGGGTGGHVIPALAIAHELQSHYNAEVLFIGTARGIETPVGPRCWLSPGTDYGWCAEPGRSGDPPQDTARPAEGPCAIGPADLGVFGRM